MFVFVCVRVCVCVVFLRAIVQNKHDRYWVRIYANNCKIRPQTHLSRRVADRFGIGESMVRSWAKAENRSNIAEKMKQGPKVRDQKGIGSPRHYLCDVDDVAKEWLRDQRDQGNQVHLLTTITR